MSDLRQNLEYLTECTVCLNRYEKPLLLSCGHTFCKKCLKPLMIPDKTRGKKDSSRYAITCPNCRKQQQVAELDELPVNSMMNSMLDSLRVADKRSGKQSGEACGSCRKTPHSVFCLQCNLQMCSTCLQKHYSSTGTRHTVLQKDAVTVCRSHDRPCAHICARCKQLVCVQCLLDSCVDHEYRDISDVSKIHLRPESENLKRCEGYFEHLRRSQSIMFKDLRTQIGSHIEKMINLLYDDRNKLEAQLEELEMRSFDLINEEESRLICNLDELNNEVAKDPLLGSGIPVRIMRRLIEADTIPASKLPQVTFTPSSDVSVGTIHKEDIPLPPANVSSQPVPFGTFSRSSEIDRTVANQQEAALYENVL